MKYLKKILIRYFVFKINDIIIKKLKFFLL
jgi:hypothetical protein